MSELFCNEITHLALQGPNDGVVGTERGAKHGVLRVHPMGRRGGPGQAPPLGVLLAEEADVFGGGGGEGGLQLYFGG